MEEGQRECHLTNRSSGRVRDKVPSTYTGVRAAQLNRLVSLVPGDPSSIEEKLQLLQELAQAALDDELPNARQWINDASLDALDKIRVLRATARVNLALIPVGQELRAHL